MSRGLVRIYRTGDDYRRYSWENPDRRASLTSFFKTFRRYFGRSVLDLGCSGGVLGAVMLRQVALISAWTRTPTCWASRASSPGCGFSKPTSRAIGSRGGSRL